MRAKIHSSGISTKREKHFCSNSNEYKFYDFIFDKNLAFFLQINQLRNFDRTLDPRAQIVCHDEKCPLLKAASMNKTFTG